MIETSTHPHAQAIEILGQYATEVHPPVLDQAQQEAVERYLAATGMEARMGISGFGGGPDSTPTATEVLLGSDLGSRKLIDRHPQAVVGPHFIAGQYNPDGISIYVPALAEAA